MEDENKRRQRLRRNFLSLSKLDKFKAIPKKSTPGKCAYILLFRRIEINATKFEKTRIDFKSDVFDAVAVVVAVERREALGTSLAK